MFKKILIANRGEIACRIIRTSRRMGIQTVAVYSEADAGALHVRTADEAVPIGPPAASQSYLAIDAIIEACRQTGADAVHPGYGFLSENARFVDACDAAGIIFIGPPASAVRAMGDKIESKRLAKEAGVNTIPGHPEALDDGADLEAIARAIGFPLMIKAAAGGGGKGMRVAKDAQGLEDALERTRSEARSSFGDDRIFIEKFVTNPRHIEIQILADRHGHVLHLGERECSLQRRHQKVIEEAPSPFLDAATRRAMGEQAVALAQRVGYVSAGTVEFVTDAEKNFYFLEMNTRLQVEHPVTEAITGIDLVEQMIRIAAGEPLPFREEDIRLDGWAMEARLYAEDATRGFLPSTGRLTRYEEPQGPGIRIDTGVDEGSEIAVHYDPMIAKLTAHGADRDEARTRLIAALEAYVIRGPVSNASFLTSLLDHPRFIEGDLTTGFIGEHFGPNPAPAVLDHAILEELAAIAVAMHLKLARRAAGISGQLAGWTYEPERFWSVSLGETMIEVEWLPDDERDSRYRVDGRELDVKLAWRPGEHRIAARIDGRPLLLQADRRPEGYTLRHRGAVLDTIVRTRLAADYVARMPKREKADAKKRLTSPMPGQIISIAVAPGDKVEPGQELCVLEAMKMENVLRADSAGEIEAVNVQPRDTVNVDDVLLTFA